MLAAIATSKAAPAALPWEDAAPVCGATIKLVADATRGWHRTTHWLHRSDVRGAVFAVLVVADRLQHKQDALSAREHNLFLVNPCLLISPPPPVKRKYAIHLRARALYITVILFISGCTRRHTISTPLRTCRTLVPLEPRLGRREQAPLHLLLEYCWHSSTLRSRTRGRPQLGGS